jgi:hypothetical protein
VREIEPLYLANPHPDVIRATDGFAAEYMCKLLLPQLCAFLQVTSHTPRVRVKATLP